ncbi:hypothetical protein [Acinetobacter guillouiae]|uniref:hypothetical protein n=1 Tax=Acinetobacter guillouiae TaxID=106649 RepID=UPI0002D12F9B|nr:hypothetical protein [Acinetobacter guillouiae]ENU56744.1 hypothetical protein F981_04251 [Acinetobacter guillouiae CIP 63.46]KAB0623680.1 hypothetical protein F7P82_20245 [Acinetobacter guillouiae]
MTIPTQRYRLLGYVCTGINQENLTREFVCKGNTIYQSNSLDEVLIQVKALSESNPECTKFVIERGEWL